MTVDAIRLRNFMAFKDTDWVDLRPITLLFGRNSSGKSAFIRALLLLKQSLTAMDDAGPLRLASMYGPDFGSFKELVHGGDDQSHLWFYFRCSSVDIQTMLTGLELSIESVSEDAPPHRMLQIGLGYAPLRSSEADPDLSRIEFSDLSISTVARDGSNEVLLFQAGLLELEDAEHYEDDWFVAGNLVDRAKPGSWLGFGCYVERNFLDIRFKEPDRGTPDGFDVLEELYRMLRTEVDAFLNNIIHLGPVRPVPQRRYSFDQRTAFEWKEKDWTAFLEFFEGRQGRSEVEETGSWLQHLRLAENAEARLASGPGALVSEFEVAVAEPGQTSTHPLSAMGYGTSQILPIVLQCVSAKPGSLVIVEQPELHLHPRAQAALGDMYPSLIRRDIRKQRRKHRLDNPDTTPQPAADAISIEPPRFLLETHSEHLLLRFRNCIALTHLKSLRDELDYAAEDSTVPGRDQRPLMWPSDVAIVFVDRPWLSIFSHLTTLTIDCYGDLTDQPPGFTDFFSDDAKEIMAITRSALIAEGLEEGQET